MLFFSFRRGLHAAHSVVVGDGACPIENHLTTFTLRYLCVAPHSSCSLSCRYCVWVLTGPFRIVPRILKMTARRLLFMYKPCFILYRNNLHTPVGGNHLMKASSHCGGSDDVLRGQMCMISTAYSVPFVVILDLTVAVVNEESASAKEKSDQWGEVQVVACVGRAVGALWWRDGGGRGAGRDGEGAAACRKRRSSNCRLRSECTWLLLSAWSRGTWSLTRRRGRCDLW